jgi:hypothetical protein
VIGPEVCTQRLAGGPGVIGEPCPGCGHTNLVHPGSKNPSLDACALCKILALATRLEEMATSRYVFTVPINLDGPSPKDLGDGS